MKISIVGVGRVGSALGLALVAKQLVDDLVLVGRRSEVTRGEAMDLLHATAFDKMATVRAGDLQDTGGSHIIVICIGVPGVGWARAAGAAGNVAAFEQMIPTLVALSPEAVFLIATNPVDAMTTRAGQLSGLPAERVIGTGTLLDTMRLRIMLSERCGIAPRDIRAYVLGEHGDSQFVAFSSASAGGGRLAIEPAELGRIESAVRTAGHEIARCKGYTNHGIALATAHIIQAIANDSREIMPLSVEAGGFCGVHGVCLSLPVVIGRGGVVQRIAMELSAQEVDLFRHSAEVVERTLHQACRKGEVPDGAGGHAAGQPKLHADCI